MSQQEYREAAEEARDSSSAVRDAGAGASTAGPSNDGPSNAGPSTAGPSTAGPSTAEPSTAEPFTSNKRFKGWIDPQYEKRARASVAAAEARGPLDMHALGRDVLHTLEPAAPLSFDEVLRQTARTNEEVSHVLLATLYLATAGNVRVVEDPCNAQGNTPISPSTFSLELLSDDDSQYKAATEHFRH